MNYRAVIFDMDGTITDTEHIWHEAFKQLLQRHNVSLEKNHELAILHKITGLGLLEKSAIIKELAGLQESLEVIAREKLDLAKRLYGQHIRLMNGFADFHKALQARQLKTGVATNADDETLEITKRALKLEHFFGNHIYGISRVNNMGKPNPAIYLHAARMLGEKPEHCIAIEDSAHGINAARSAGMFCIGFNAAGQDEQVARAHLKVCSYDEIDLDRLPLVPKSQP